MIRARIRGMHEISSPRVSCFVLLWAMSLAVMVRAQTPQTPSDSVTKGSDSGDAKPFISGKDGTSVPSCSYMPRPPYSKEAKAAKYQGTVLVEGIVTLDGRITNLRVLKSPGLGLEESVLKTLKTWKCKPATHEGKPVPTLTPFEITFRLK